MEWFDYLIEQGYFEPSTNPEPVQAENEGFYIPYWQPLDFLEKLADKFREGRHLESVQKVLDIIHSISSQPKDNYHTWYVFLKVIDAIPNDQVPLDILHFIPVWLRGLFRPNIQTVELCEKLLPKFLNIQPTLDDIAKANTILRHVFSLYQKQNSYADERPEFRYKSNVYLYYLRRTIPASPLRERITQYCGDAPLIHILDQLNPALRSNPVTTHWIVGGVTYEVDYLPDGLAQVLTITRTEGGAAQELYKKRIENAAIIPAHQLVESLRETTKQLNLAWPDDALRNLSVKLSTDLFSVFEHNSFQRLDDEVIHGDEAIPAFSFCLRELFREKAIAQPEQTIALLSFILIQPAYGLPFYRRLVLYTIGTNWKALRSVFWQMVPPGDPNHYFSFFPYRPELSRLLQLIQSELTESEAKILSEILAQGPQPGFPEPEPDRWRFQWLSALKGNPAFSADYAQFAPRYLATEVDHFKPRSRSSFLMTPISPLTDEEILNLSAEELSAKIVEFREPQPGPPGPTIKGFATALEHTTADHPEHFDPMLGHLLPVPYIYAAHLIDGYISASRTTKSFDWSSLLEFCQGYIDQPAFLTDELYSSVYQSEDNQLSVIGSIGTLIAVGLRDDSIAYAKELLPLTKQILLQLLAKIQVIPPETHIGNSNYPSLLGNSAAGQLLKGLLDYLLRQTRLLREDGRVTDIFAAEPEIQAALERMFQQGSIEAHTIVGMYLEQFCYLDFPWTISTVNAWHTLDEQSWRGFMGGLIFGRAAYNKELFEALNPHYQRTLPNLPKQDEAYKKAIVQHFILFYIWGYEDIEDPQSLNGQALSEFPAYVLQEYVQFFLGQFRLLRDYSEEELENIRSKVLKLWSISVQTFNQPATEPHKTLFGSFVHLIEYFPVLNEQNTELLIQSVPYVAMTHNLNILLSNLLRFRDLPPADRQPTYLARILEKTPFSYITSAEATALVVLVRILFENGEREAANRICRQVQLSGSDALKELYFENNPR